MDECKLKPFFNSHDVYLFREHYKYPVPKYECIIEPFAGCASYSMAHYDRNVVLYEVDEKVYGIWEYLIKANRDDILGLRSGDLVDSWGDDWDYVRPIVAEQVKHIKHWKIWNRNFMDIVNTRATWFIDLFGRSYNTDVVNFWAMSRYGEKIVLNKNSYINYKN